MKTITLLNEKGGVGKTTLATTLAAGYANMGASVLLIDADAQGQASIAFGARKEPGFYDLLKRMADWRTVLKTIPADRYAPNGHANGRLALLPGNDETRSIASVIPSATLLWERLAEVESAFDFVIVDTAPTPSLLHSVVLFATDALVYPTKLESWSLDGLKESLLHVKQFNRSLVAKDYRPEVHMAGIVPNMTELGTTEHADNMNTLAQQFGNQILRPIPKRTAWRESTSAALSIFAYAPGSAEAESAQNFVEGINASLAS